MMLVFNWHKRISENGHVVTRHEMGRTYDIMDGAARECLRDGSARKANVDEVLAWMDEQQIKGRVTHG